MAFFQIVFIFFLFSTQVFSEEQKTPKDEYLAGVAAYQAKDFEKAKANLSKAMNAQPNDPQILYNLGLAEFQVGNKGWALALWRKALNIDPLFKKPQEALDFAQETMGGLAFRRARGNWAFLMSNVVNPLPFDLFIALSLVFFFIGSFYLMRFVGRRKTALENELPMPAFPVVAVAASLLFLISATLTSTKGLSILQAKATVVAKKVEIRTGPNKEENALIELYEGAEVTLKDNEKDWIQIEYFDDISGWIPRDSILQTSGPKL